MCDVVELDDYREIWKSELVICYRCTYTWTAVFHKNLQELECPNCEAMTEFGTVGDYEETRDE